MFVDFREKKAGEGEKEREGEGERVREKERKRNINVRNIYLLPLVYTPPCLTESNQKAFGVWGATPTSSAT